MVDADGDSLRILYLHKNMLSGDVPAELGNLTSLTNLWLNGNMLTGDVPSELAACPTSCGGGSAATCSPGAYPRPSPE